LVGAAILVLGGTITAVVALSSPDPRPLQVANASAPVPTTVPGPTAAGVTADSPIVPAAGVALLTETYAAPAPGWPEGTDVSGGAATVEVGRGYLLDVGTPDGMRIGVPVDAASEQVMVSFQVRMRHTVLGSLLPDHGFAGVHCQRFEGQEPAAMGVVYELRLASDGGWALGRVVHVPGLPPAAAVIGLGASPPLLVEAAAASLVCATLPGTTSTRLAVLGTDGVVQYSIVDTVMALPAGPWVAALNANGPGWSADFGRVEVRALDR